jgi:hypothetical protein
MFTSTSATKIVARDIRVVTAKHCSIFHNLLDATAPESGATQQALQPLL